LSSGDIADVAGSMTDGSLIEVLLTEQGDLTAVERFSQFHEHVVEPIQGRYYSALLPAEPPGPGQQYAFEVDLDRCSGCKACVAACHALNGLDESESFRDVGMLVNGGPGLPVLQHVTTACHHCLDPACLNACPVDAYEKDPVTGIVKHLDDQCFGCQYCTLACPYDVPKFHEGKGIVRKCDMCGDRLKTGEAPACVQACPHEAIRIRVVDRAAIIASAQANTFLPTAPAPDYTLPTTRFKSTRPLSDDLQPADYFRLEPEHAHVPLVIMLVLTQLAVGGYLMDFVVRLAGMGGSINPAVHQPICLAIAFLGLAASTCHLGRPIYAFRALIGLGHSWLSREILTLGIFAHLALVYTALVMIPALGLSSILYAIPGLGMMRPGLEWYQSRPGLQLALAALVVVSGIAGVISSVMVYHVVRRPFWRVEYSGTKFAGTSIVLGLASAVVALPWSAVVAGALVLDGPRWEILHDLCLVLMAAVAAKLVVDAFVLVHLRDAGLTPLRRSALLICGPLVRVSVLRLALGLLGGAVLPLLVLAAGPKVPSALDAVLLTLAFVTLIGGELVERYVFFAAVVRPKMPGGILS
jgi:Fe-S-cluster-containing dehydrogenase component/DMSO reductase anchor subunit